MNWEIRVQKNAEALKQYWNLIEIWCRVRNLMQSWNSLRLESTRMWLWMPKKHEVSHFSREARQCLCRRSGVLNLLTHLCQRCQYVTFDTYLMQSWNCSPSIWLGCQWCGRECQKPEKHVVALHKWSFSREARQCSCRRSDRDGKRIQNSSGASKSDLDLNLNMCITRSQALSWV